MLILPVICSVHDGSMVLLEVLAVLQQAAGEDVHDDVRLADVYQHVVFQDLYSQQTTPRVRNQYLQSEWESVLTIGFSWRTKAP